MVSALWFEMCKKGTVRTASWGVEAAPDGHLFRFLGEGVQNKNGGQRMLGGVVDCQLAG